MLSRLLGLLESSFAAEDQIAPRLKISDRFPNPTLKNQFGRSVRFREDFIADGRALIINSMYTKCRGSCPVTSAKLEYLREALTPVFGKGRLSIVSFSLEPAVDTSAELLRYAARYGAAKDDSQLCDWHFLTGNADAIESLRRGLGFFDLNPVRDRDITQHASQLLIGNSTSDRWTSMPAELRTSLLVATTRRVAGFTFEQKYGIPS